MALTPEGREIRTPDGLEKFGLKDVLSPENGCVICAGTLQKEFIPLEETTDRFALRFNIPGYGCTSCPTKIYDKELLKLLYLECSRTLILEGEEEDANFYLAEAISLESILSKAALKKVSA